MADLSQVPEFISKIIENVPARIMGGSVMTLATIYDYFRKRDITKVQYKKIFVYLALPFYLFTAFFMVWQADQKEISRLNGLITTSENSIENEKQEVEMLINMSLLDMDENIAYCRVFSKFASMKDKDIISLLNDNPLPKSLEIDTLLLNTFFRKNYSTALYSLSLSQKNLRKILESADKPNKTIKATGSNISIYCSYSQFIKVQLIATLQLINNEINENRFKEIYQKSIKDILFKNAVEVDFPG